MCGIFAWAGKNPAKFSKDKFDLLGIINESRGTHSCGVTSDGDIKVGIDSNKVYRDFIQNVKYEKPEIYPYVIGHTRHATFGSHTVHNAHPFGYGGIPRKVKGEDEWFYEFVGVHNGSLLNHKDLIKDRDIDLQVTSKKDNTTTIHRTKIDSEVLLECIYKDKDWKVLSEYNGAAALIFANNNEPNVVYFYHGACKEYNYKSSKVEEERPLYYYKETRNSLYISSIEDSLLLIGGTEKTIGQFDHNTVYKVTNGNIEKAVKFKISRAKNFKKETWSSSSNSHNNCNFTPTQDTYSKQAKTSYPSNNTNKKGALNSTENIYDEKVNHNVYGNKIYLEKLRYCRNGHLINGIYCYIKEYDNIIFFGRNLKEAESFFWSKVNKPFFEGDFINFKDRNLKDSIIPFVHNDKNEITHIPFLYFFEGIRLKDELDYQSCIEAKKNKRGWDYQSLSCCATHPIINIGTYKGKADQDIVFENEPFSGNIAPLLSRKIYEIKNGNLVSWRYKEIENKKDDNQTSLLVIQSLEEVVDELENNNNDAFLNERLDKEIEEIFTAPYKKFPSLLKSLDRYSHLPKGEEAIEVIETFIEGMSNLITIEMKE